MFLLLTPLCSLKSDFIAQLVRATFKKHIPKMKNNEKLKECFATSQKIAYFLTNKTQSYYKSVFRKCI